MFLFVIWLLAAPVQAEDHEHVGGEDVAPSPDHHQHLAHQVGGVPLQEITKLEEKLIGTNECQAQAQSQISTARFSLRLRVVFGWPTTIPGQRICF